MSNEKPVVQTVPVAPLKIAALDSCLELGKKVNNYLLSFKKML